jgi:hypothetical protein
MKSNNDALKKHHFWILVGLAPLFVLLAVVFMMTGVSGAIEKANKEVADADTAMKGAKAPGQGTIQAIEKNKDVLDGVRGKLWKMNWDKQADYFTWPETSNGMFDRYNTMKFGTNFRDFIGSNASETFKPAYASSYVQLGESIKPTEFKGGWRSVLRWVRNWGGQSLESKQLWLVMEDLWVQRAMLDPINKVNDQIARFALVKPDGAMPPPRKRKFVSRVWELDLSIEPRDQGAGLVMKGKLKNRTNQLQVLGTGSAMKLNVWLDPRMDLPPFEFRVEGAGVGGGETIDVPPLPTHVIPPGTSVEEIAKVVQVLDNRTVPIRRLDRLAIGYSSSKDAAKEMQPPTFWAEADPAATTAGSAAPPTGESGETSGTTPGFEGESGPPGAYAGGMTGGAAAGGKGRAGGLRLLDIANGNRKRYIEVTPQLRRVPVAFTLIVDQMYVNDVLIAYANSPLRFETTQVHWTRFTEPLNQPNQQSPTDPSGGQYSDYGAGGEATTASGFAGSGLSSGSPYGSGYPPGGPGGFEGGIPGGGSFSGGSFGNPYGGIPGLGADTLSSVSEAQANSGLVQLTIYGLITLYERYEEPKKEGEAATAADATAKPADGEKPMTPMPETPAAPEKKPDPAAAPEKKAETPAEPEKKPDAPAPAEPKKDPPK